MELATARLRLDALRREDAAALFAYRADPAVSRYQGWRPASCRRASGARVEPLSPWERDWGEGTDEARGRIPRRAGCLRFG